MGSDVTSRISRSSLISISISISLISTISISSDEISRTAPSALALRCATRCRSTTRGVLHRLYVPAAARPPSSHRSRAYAHARPVQGEAHTCKRQTCLDALEGCGVWAVVARSLLGRGSSLVWHTGSHEGSQGSSALFCDAVRRPSSPSDQVASQTASQRGSRSARRFARARCRARASSSPGATGLGLPGAAGLPGAPARSTGLRPSWASTATGVLAATARAARKLGAGRGRTAAKPATSGAGASSSIARPSGDRTLAARRVGVDFSPPGAGGGWSPERGDIETVT
eukprot:scaffold101034_cov63-Phaeocystis_antarctica.AAC.1